jgi:hypothetical protein
MEHFEVKSGPFKAIKTGIGIVNIIAAILMFVVYFDSHSVSLVLTPVFFLFNGIYFLTNGFGLEKSWFRTGDNFIIIKWANKVRPVQIHDIRIERISLERTKVIIFQKSKKPIKLNIDYLEREQKTQVYEFLIEYAKQRNIKLERHSSTML